MVRLAVCSIAATAGFDLDEAEDLKTAVCEACKNVSCHGFNGFSDKYEIEVSVENGFMEIVVKDDCDKHTLEKLSKPCQSCPNEGDLGIYVIESLVNEVQFGSAEDGHKSIRMVKRK